MNGNTGDAAVFADAHHISLNETVKNALTAYVYSH